LIASSWRVASSLALMISSSVCDIYAATFENL